MSDKTFLESVVTAASQGAAGAIIGATLAAVTDPVTNRVLVRRMTLKEAMNDISKEQIVNYFQTTLPTNFIKFPLFEVLNEVTRKIDIPPSMRGVVTGAIFTTATLPLTNYRYCKSVGEEVDLYSPKLWKAYFPTVVRDIIYANVRNQIAAYLAKAYPDMNQSVRGRVGAMFFTVVLACILSSPCNEWRGYTLQPENRKLAVHEFFKPVQYLRSTLMGSTTMGISLGIATVVGPPIQQLLPRLKDPEVLGVVLAGAVVLMLQKYQKKCDDKARRDQLNASP